MGNVPRLYQPSPDLLKFSEFLEHDELITLVEKYQRFKYVIRLKQAKCVFRFFEKTIFKMKYSGFCESIFSFIFQAKLNILYIVR